MMASKKLVVMCVWTLTLVALVAMFFTYVIYFHSLSQREQAKTSHDLAILDYQAKIATDRHMVQLELTRYIDLLDKQNINSSDLRKISKSSDQLKNNLTWTLRGLSGKVDPKVRYDKDLRLPSGFTTDTHETYRRCVQATLNILDKNDGAKILDDQVRTDLVKKLQEQLSKLRDINKIK